LEHLHAAFENDLSGRVITELTNRTFQHVSTFRHRRRRSAPGGGGGAETFVAVLNSAELSHAETCGAGSWAALVADATRSGSENRTEIVVFSSKPYRNRPTLASMKP